MYPLLLSSTPSSTLTFQLRVPALPHSHSSRFSSPPTVHRFNHEYLLPSRSIRIVRLASFDPSYNFLSFFPCLPRFTARSVSFPFSAAIAFLLHSSGCSTIFPLPVFRPTRSAFLFLWLSFYLGKALSSVKSICLCSDTNLNLFFLSLSLLIFLSFSFSVDARRWFTSFSLLSTCIRSLKSESPLRFHDDHVVPALKSLALSPASTSLEFNTRASKGVFVTRTIHAHKHSFSRIHSRRSHRDISSAYV